MRNESKINDGAMEKFFLILKGLLCSYIVTMGLLLLIALFMYKFNLGETAVSVGIVLVYASSSFVAGLIIGKKTLSKKYIWGMLIGSIYFVLLVLVSLAVNRGINDIGTHFFTTYILCAGGGMLGGMLS